jgi:transcriptional regulator with XRE-family HTH domain
MNFAERLRTMRTARGLTQEQLAEIAMTSATFISHIETGKMLPTEELKERLKRALDWTELEDEAFKILGREPA